MGGRRYSAGRLPVLEQVVSSLPFFPSFHHPPAIRSALHRIASPPPLFATRLVALFRRSAINPLNEVAREMKARVSSNVVASAAPLQARPPGKKGFLMRRGGGFAEMGSAQDRAPSPLPPSLSRRLRAPSHIDPLTVVAIPSARWHYCRSSSFFSFFFRGKKPREWLSELSLPPGLGPIPSPPPFCTLREVILGPAPCRFRVLACVTGHLPLSVRREGEREGESSRSARPGHAAMPRSLAPGPLFLTTCRFLPAVPASRFCLVCARAVFPRSADARLVLQH